MREVDGLVGGRVVGFRVQVCWRKIEIKGEAEKKKKLGKQIMKKKVSEGNFLTDQATDPLEDSFISSMKSQNGISWMVHWWVRIIQALITGEHFVKRNGCHITVCMASISFYKKAAPVFLYFGCALQATPTDRSFTQIKTPWAPPQEGHYFSNAPLLGCYPTLKICAENFQCIWTTPYVAEFLRWHYPTLTCDIDWVTAHNFQHQYS